MKILIITITLFYIIKTIYAIDKYNRKEDEENT